MMKKYFLIGIFFVTRYDHLVCINDSFINPQAHQRRTARRTVKISRIFAREWHVFDVPLQWPEWGSLKESRNVFSENPDSKSH